VTLARADVAGGRFFVYIHLHAVHPIASCNAAEIAMGMLVVSVSVVDRAGTEVVHADITRWVTPA
jgi:hypothetical protein